ncbi:aspartic peptidase A1 [Melampsora americana]|nr:aspartic peptidase A1 [Melampsora americana]
MAIASKILTLVYNLSIYTLLIHCPSYTISSNDIHSVPLYVRRVLPTDQEKFRSDFNTRRIRRQVALENVDDVEYYGMVEIGTPKQKLPVLLDTGSDTFWVTGASTTLPDGSPSLDVSTGGPVFDPTSSSSYKPGSKYFEQSYGDGSVAKGVEVRDSVSLGTYRSKKQPFGLVNVTSPGILSANVSGIMGMAFERDDKAAPFWLRAGIKSFAFGLARFSSSSPDRTQPGGILTLGGLNRSLFSGKVNYVNVTEKDYWQITVDHVTVNGVRIKKSINTQGFIDTGNPIIQAPKDIVRAVYAGIPGAESGPAGDHEELFWIPCDSNVSFGMNFGGKSYKIPPADFITQKESQKRNGLCRGQVGGRDDYPTWIVGSVFLRNFYTVFNASEPARVGFAKPAENYQSLLGGHPV